MAYAGIVTRGIAALADLALISIITISTTIALGLIVGVVTPGKQSVGLPEILLTTAGCLTFTACYVVGFWWLVGHTPGMRLMGIEVKTRAGGRVSLACALRRLVGVVLSVFSLGLGFLIMLFDDRRRTLADRVAGTVVVRGV